MADASELAVRAIEDRIASNITSIDAAWSATANVAWQGVDFDPSSQSAWLRPVVLFAESAWGTSGVTGTGRNVLQGILQASFFSKPGVGLGASRGRIAGFRTLFDRVSLTVSGHGNVEFEPAGAPRPGPFDGAWHQLIVETVFTIEEHGSA